MLTIAGPLDFFSFFHTMCAICTSRLPSFRYWCKTFKIFWRIMGFCWGLFRLHGAFSGMHDVCYRRSVIFCSCRTAVPPLTGPFFRYALCLSLSRLTAEGFLRPPKSSSDMASWKGLFYFFTHRRRFRKTPVPCPAN